MTKQQLFDVLSTNDLEKSQSILRTQNSDDFYRQIIWLINQEIFESNEHPKERTKIINRLIGALFDSMHVYPNDLPKINQIIDEYIKELRIYCHNYLN